MSCRKCICQALVSGLGGALQGEQGCGICFNVNRWQLCCQPCGAQGYEGWLVPRDQEWREARDSALRSGDGDTTTQWSRVPVQYRYETICVRCVVCLPGDASRACRG